MNSLVEYIRDQSSQLLPIPVSTGPDIQLPKLEGIRGVVFDIYGTIMISAAGDISLAGGETAPQNAMAVALESAGVENAKSKAEAALAQYSELVKSQQEAVRARGVEFPEIEIREVWQEIISEDDPEKIEQACVAYECAANPVWPMPGLSDCLGKLRQRNYLLGIVSNAQFYTKLLFPALLENQNLKDLGFSVEAMVFSYEMREGKPSRTLYKKLADQLAANHNLSPQEILYIGNDRLKDIWPAQLEGFQTAFFAGDKRSHRWREEDSRLENVMADAVITSLDQIEEII